MEGYIDFNNLLIGKHQRARRYGPFASYDASHGATVRTNDFADRNLTISPNFEFVSLLSAIIYSARNQRDFVSIRIVNMTLPYSVNEIKAIEKITLSRIAVGLNEILITLIDKEIFKKEIDPKKYRTKLHHDYYSPDRIEQLIIEKVPQVPTVAEVGDTLRDHGINAEKVMKEIKEATNNAYSLWRD